jgi:hypothetical protein
MMTEKWINLFDAGLALLQGRGVTINGKSAAELRELIAQKRPRPPDDAETRQQNNSRNPPG